MSLVFVDTNILAYARDKRSPAKRAVAECWLTSLARSRTGRISWQVLSEFYSVATHPRKLAVPAERARADVIALQAWNPIAPDAATFEFAWRLADRHALSWWDALILAAARRGNCDLLLSEDLQNGLVIDGVLRVVDPFAATAEQPPPAEPYRG